MNRVLHVELRPSQRNWLVWAYEAGIHPFVLKYIETRHDHLFEAPSKTEEPFSTPRSWHILSDSLNAYGDALTPELVGLLAAGTVSRPHALNFTAFVRGLLEGVAINDILAGKAPLPLDPAQRDLLTFIVQAMRAQLIKELPPTKGALSADMKQRLHVVRGLVADIGRADEELVILLFAREEGDGSRNYPAWFLADMSSTLGRLAERIRVEEQTSGSV